MSDIRQLTGSNQARRVVEVVTNKEMKNTSVTWANSAAANTTKDVDIALPTSDEIRRDYEFIIHNPSTVTALTVSVTVKWTDSDSNTRYSEVKSIAVGTGSGVATVVTGALIGDACRVTLSNDTALGLTDGFTAYLQVREL